MYLKLDTMDEAHILEVEIAPKAITALRAAIEQAEQPKYDPIELHVLHSHIAGVLYDFMGWLTSREKRLTLSMTDEASPAVEAITKFAKMRGLSLDDARVQDWQDNTTSPQRTWVGLTDEEILSDDTMRYYYGMNGGAGPVSQKGKKIVAAIEAKLKEKNT